MSGSKPTTSLNKLKSSLQEAVQQYNDQTTKEPFWFVYLLPSAKDKVVEATCDLPTLANVLRMKDEDLITLVNEAGRKVFNTLENSLNIVIREFNKSKFFMLGNKENVNGVHSPMEQFKSGFEIPNWVRRIPKIVGGAMADSSFENDSNSASKTVRGKDRQIKHLCGECGEFELPSRYEPILSSVKEELDNTVERLKHEVASLQRKVLELDRNMEDQHKEFQKSLKGLEQQIKQQTDDKIKRDEEAQKFIRIGRNVISTLNNDKWMGSPSSYRFYSLAWAQCPQISSESLSQLIPLVVAGFLSDCYVNDEIDFEKIPNAIPSPNSIKKIIRVGRNIVLHDIAKMLDNDPELKVAMAQDKGERDHLGRLIRDITVFKEGYVKAFRIDCDGSGGTDEAVAASIDATLSQLDEYREGGNRTLLSGMCTDTGGGGVMESVVEELVKLNRMTDIYFVGNCSLHALSKCLQNAYESAFGIGGLTNVTTLQFLHCCYALEEALGTYEFRRRWKLANPNANVELMIKLQKPVLTRWGYVNKTAEMVLEDFDEWIRMFRFCYENSSKKDATISSNGYSMDHSKIRIELEFFVAFNKVFWRKHFAWMHRTDDKSKRFGHSSHEMPVRVFLMEHQLRELHKNNCWKSNDAFKTYIELLNKLPSDVKDDKGNITHAGKDTTIKQVKIFWREFLTTFKKHFQLWKQRNLIFTLASSNMKSSVIFAKWWIGEEDHDSIARIAEEYSEELDPVHECQINYTQWYTYLTKLTKPECELLSIHRDAIRYIATTKKDLYASTNEGVQKLLCDLQKYILNLPSHTQYTESGVQDISLASKNRKSQYDASSISIIRAFDNQAVNKVLLDNYSSKFKQGNQYRTSGASDNDRLNIHIRSVNAFDNRQKGISQFRRRALPTKERSVLLIQRGIQFIPNEDVIRRIAAYLRRNDLNSQSRKRLREHESNQFDVNKAKRDKKLDAGHKRVKYATNLKQRPVTLNDTFKKTVEFTWFTRKALRSCCMKEIEARNPNHENVRNGYKIDGKNMIAKQLKELLVTLVKEDDKDATAVELKHPDNILLHEKRYLERLYKGELKSSQIELYLANQDNNEETIECSLEFDF